MSQIPCCSTEFRRADHRYETLPGGTEGGAPFLSAEQLGQDRTFTCVLEPDRRPR